MIQLLWVLAIGYAGLLLAVGIFQRRLIYFPTRFSATAAEAMARRSGFVAARNAAGEILGWKITPTNPPTGSVLIFHGNAGCALDRDYLARPIHDALPLEVIIVEYPGYGPRDGAPNLATILATAEAALALLPTNRPVYLVSESLGTGAAAHLARKFPDRIAGLAMIAPYDDFGRVAQSAMPLLPARWLLRDPFLPAAWLSEFHGPLQILLAGADEVISIQRGQSLYDGYAGPKRLQTIPGARHNEVAEQTPEWWLEVFAFFRQHHAAVPAR